MPRPSRGQLLDGALVLGVAAAVSAVSTLLGVPSPTIFGGLVAGLGRALVGRRRMMLPRSGSTAAQAVIGVSIGSLVDADTLTTIGRHWLPVLLATVASLVVSLVAGRLMGLRRDVTPVTGAFAMIASGASGITAMARDLEADEQVVAVLQYLRVLVIVVAMPVVATTVFDASAGSGGAVRGGAGVPADLLFTVACTVVGIVLGRLAHLPVAALLGPMLVAAAAAADLTGVAGGATAPAAVEAAAFLVIGLQVGLGFTRTSLVAVARLLPLALLLIVAVVLACAGLGVLLARTAGVSALTGYLATTPGGLYAVLATATASGADATFVLAVQVLRLFVMLLTAPLLARLLRPRGAG
ncbi:AbrB family transcriptional regulator [Modestobacter sp. I12A-02628]|uniref:AbrB family transcriptional regulator n=1 Tax=Goekera deserti TaxID=2497753 RepID=A0A7K3WEV6_9ACTN|nr:AbrB family transcriptional regulator [Goekera deserti]MPQ98078.1 AbrB family transcriptional regulator [Goekera deserti]NDI48725.1 AbrB family transcriptional regulator [Goekera deserti]NEL54896.1 AbrB family transcriptional regulator [Goekera deserti]